MATNPYSYGSLGQRWTVGEPTSKSLLDVSRVKADANRWALEQLIVDPDDTANFVLTAPGLNIDSNTLYVDSANNSVGFGLTNPNDYAFNGTPSWVASGGAGNASVIVVSGTTSIGYLAFADGTTGTDRYSGNIQYNHSTNTMSFETNGGVEAMSIDSAQDVSLPAGYLKVSGNPSAGTISSNGNGQIGGLTGNGLFAYGKGSTYDLALANANTTVALAIPTGGSATPDVYIPNSLGLGTSSPSSGLHISKTSTQLPIANFQGNEDVSVKIESTFTSSAGAGIFLEFDDAFTSTTDAFQIGVPISGTNFAIGYGTQDDFRVTDSLLTVTTTGCVGIGTSSPSNALSVEKSISNDWIAEFKQQDATAGQSYGVQIAGGTNASDIALGVYNQAVSPLFTVRGDGNVGISTTSPSQKLDVAGDVIIDNGTTSTLYFDANTNWMQLISGDFRFGLGSAEKVRILASGGITFNGDTSVDNALSDFETGSFTPTIIATTTNPTVGYSVQYGRYTKVGNIVTVQLKIDLSSFSGGSGQVNIGGLPFTSNSDSNYRSAGSVAFSRNVTNGGGAIMLNLGPNTTKVSLIKYTDADNYDTVLAPSDLASNSIIHAAITYEAQ